MLETTFDPVKGELQRENKMITYERAFKMLENDMYIAGIGQAVLDLSFKDVRGWQFLTMKAAETLCVVCLPPEEHISWKKYLGNRPS